MKGAGHDRYHTYTQEREVTFGSRALVSQSLCHKRSEEGRIKKEE